MNNPLKIAHITYCYQPIIGGQEIYIDNMIRMFDRIGAISTVYQPVNKRYHYFSSQKDERIRFVFNFPFLGRYIKNIGKYLFSIFLLAHFFFFLKQDVIIVHYAFHSWPLWFLSKRVIVLSHGVEWYLENQTFNDKLHQFIAKLTFNRFTLVANDTHYFRTFNMPIEPATNYFHEVSTNKWFIPNCVDPQKFSKTDPLPEFKNTKIILVPRQIVVDRGIHLAIEAFHLFSQDFSDYRLLILGATRGPKYKGYCDELVNQYGLHDKVIWRHNVTNNDIHKYYASAKLTLIPTLRREGTSLSAIESMACGCPTVTTNIAGLRDLPGIQAEIDPVEIRNKMVYAINNADEISLLQQTIIINQLNLTNWERAWLKVINDHINKNKIPNNG